MRELVHGVFLLRTIHPSELSHSTELKHIQVYQIGRRATLDEKHHPPPLFRSVISSHSTKSIQAFNA